MLKKVVLCAALVLGAGLCAQAAELHDAVRAGNLAQVKKLVGGTDLNVKDSNGDTALTLAMLGGHTAEEMEKALDESLKQNTTLKLPIAAKYNAIARLLIARGAQFSASESEILSPLSLAALTGNKEMVNFLLAHKADVNLGSPLLFALTTRNDDIASKLIAKGANVKASGGGLPAPLVAAAMHGDAPMINLLLAKGADANARDETGDTALHVAARIASGAQAIATLVEHGADKEAKGKDGNTPLLAAADANNRDSAQALLAKGAFVNARNNDGRTALMLAEMANNTELAHLLIASGADVNLADNEGNTPLAATAFSSAQEVEFLLAKGADANIKSANGIGPLFWAANKDVAAIFIARGADVNARGSSGVTPLYNAAALGHKDVVELLLAHGADVHTKLANGKTALFAAGDADTAALLLEKGADVNVRSKDGRTPLFTARNQDVAALFIARGADVSATAADGDTPLHAMASRHADETARLLLEHGAEVNARNNEGRTPLHIAVDQGQRTNVKVLLAHSANVNAAAGNGMTPLFYTRDKAMAAALINAGANVNAKAGDGLTPLFYAHDREVAATLAAAGAQETPVAFHEPDMAAIPAGSVDMAATAEDRLPARHLDIAKFEMGKTEVTQAEFRALMGYNPSNFKGANLPVDSVYWSEMQEYIKRLNQKTGKQYRLPTEGEWQYACLANTHTTYCGGDDPNDAAWWGKGSDPAEGNSSGTTHPAGTKKPNAFGLYDMSGNLAEWTVTPGVSYADNGHAEPGKATRAPLRGGSWLSGADDLRATARRLDYILPRSAAIGIRLARTVQ